MRAGRQTLESKGMSELAQAIVWIVLFSLVMGVWATSGFQCPSSDSDLVCIWVARGDTSRGDG